MTNPVDLKSLIPEPPLLKNLWHCCNNRKKAMSWRGKGVGKTTIFYLKCANTFVEDCLFPCRPRLSQVFFWPKKCGKGKSSAWFCFYAYMLTILLPVCSLDHGQEPITRSLQLSHIPVTAFSQTDPLLVWIYLEFRTQKEPHWTIAIISTDQCRHVGMMSTCSREAALFYPYRSVLM